jgi:beta-lactamase superfamily II metal-dependent hydrolase
MRVRAYNVLQGDAFLITVPDKGSDGVETRRHILIDVGNGHFQSDTPYESIIKNVLSVTDQKPVDLYVMTHEHMDHVEGLYYAKKKKNLDVKANYAWLTASAGPGYYDDHPEAKRALELAQKSIKEIERYLEAAPPKDPKTTKNLLRINNFESTNACVDHLKTIAPNRTYYVYRGINLKGKHPFKEAKLKILAPEEDTSSYYLGVQSTPLGVSKTAKRFGKPAMVEQKPPGGVDASAFYNLVDCRRSSYADGLLSIDAAKNNTSVVFSLKWRGWNFLFTGDAEHKSWETMYDEKVLSPVDFIKIGHHGSHNATPEDTDILTKILPKAPKNQQAWGVIPVGPNDFGHPHDDAVKRLKGRCAYDETSDLDEGSYQDYKFEG